MLSMSCDWGRNIYFLSRVFPDRPHDKQEWFLQVGHRLRKLLGRAHTRLKQRLRMRRGMRRSKMKEGGDGDDNVEERLKRGDDDDIVSCMARNNPQC